MNNETLSSSSCGRYAPSPTGRLHLGNLRTALIAWLQCRLQDGLFIIRIDDLDQPRNRPGATEQILEDLRWIGLDWDRGPDSDKNCIQSERIGLYEQAFQTLLQQGRLFPCRCSRKDIALALSAPDQSQSGSVYPGTCRPTSPRSSFADNEEERAWRYRVDDVRLSFIDQIMGKYAQDLAREVGDFVIKRRDGLFAYQLASVVDDGLMGITDIVRGGDLVDSAPRQIALFNALGYAVPRFWHVPLMKDEAGQIMSKRDGSTSLQQRQESGKTAEEVIGVLAFSLGLIDREEAVSARELCQTLSLAHLQQALERLAQKGQSSVS